MSPLAHLALSLHLVLAPVAAGASATDAFRGSHAAVTKLVAAKAADTKIQSEVDGFFDYEALAEQSLGGAKHYASRCAPRCAEFEALLTRLIRHHYLTRVKQANSGTVTFTGETVRKNGTMAKVDTTVAFTKNGQSQSVEVAYVLQKRDTGWRVTDIYTDGVGLAKTYRHQFKKVIDEGGIDLLVQRLQKKLAELEG
jgi:ABC-type transporter MlaC component